MNHQLVVVVMVWERGEDWGSPRAGEGLGKAHGGLYTQIPKAQFSKLLVTFL